MSDTKHKRKKMFLGSLPNMPDETMKAGRMRIDTDGAKEAAKHGYQRQGTVSDFRQAYMIGGGDFGASVHGTPDNYIYHIAKNDLWWEDYDANPPCYYQGGFENMRQRIRAGDPTIKQEIYAAANNRTNHPTQTSAARLTLHLCSGGIFGGVREQLDIHSGTITQTFNCGDPNGIICGQGFSIRSCISPAEEVMVIACSAAQGLSHLGKLSLELTKDPMEVSRNSGNFTPEEIRKFEEEIEKYYTPVPFTEDGDFGFTMRLKTGPDPENSPDFHYVVRMRASDEAIKAYHAGSKIVAEGRPEGSTVCFTLTVVSTLDAEDPMKEAKARLDRVSASKPMISFISTGAWYNRHWNRSWIRFENNEIADPWFRGVYQAMASRIPGKMAAGYLAPWYQSTFANWGHHILTYEQAKTNLGLLCTNHAELLEPWFRLLEDSREKLQAFTRNFYGMRGTAYPHSISCTGVVVSSFVTLNGTMMNVQTAGETVKYCWDYFTHTGDVEFLRKIGYPFLRDAALYYHDYLLTDENGEKYIFPSRSQEYTCTLGLSDEFMTNSIVDLCLVRFTIKVAAKAARILGVDDELASEFEADVKAMRPDYAVWPDGTWKTAEDTDEETIPPICATVTNVAPISYTGEVDAWHGISPEIMEAAKRTVEKLVPKDALPWDRSFGILARLRMGDSDYAGFVARALPDEPESGYNLHIPMEPDWDITTCKGTAVTSQLLSEMLLQSHDGTLRVFPAWDKTLGDASFYSLRAEGAFLVSSELREGETAYVIIRSLVGNTCNIATPFDKLSVRDLETNELISFTEEKGIVTFETIGEHEYVLERTDKPLESFPILS